MALEICKYNCKYNCTYDCLYIEEEEAYMNQFARMSKLKCENERMKASMTCKNCKIEPVQTLLIPCKHIVSCLNCVNTIECCPLCNERKLEFIRIYFAQKLSKRFTPFY